MEGSFRGILIMNEGIRGELEKILDKIDQRISGHSRLHDRYKRRAIISEILLMGSAIILTISGLADDKYYAFLGLDPVFTRFCFSLYSIIALVIIIIAWKIDWRSIALTHGQAREKLSNLKLECRRAFYRHTSYAAMVDQILSGIFPPQATLDIHGYQTFQAIRILLYLHSSQLLSKFFLQLLDQRRISFHCYKIRNRYKRWNKG